MTPYSRRHNLNRVQQHHNYCLSADRVRIENTFGILKGRWGRLKFINTYSVSKAIEIVTAACVLHNFCYLNTDEWHNEEHEQYDQNEEDVVDDREAYRRGNEKRNFIATNLINDML